MKMIQVAMFPGEVISFVDKELPVAGLRKVSLRRSEER